MKKFRHLSLQTKLILTSLAVSIVPLVIVGYASHLDIRRALVNTADEALASAAAQTSQELDKFIRSNLDATRTEAQLPQFAEFLEMSLQHPEADPLTSEAAVEIGEMLLAHSRKDQVYILSYALLDVNGIGLIDTYAPDVGLDQSNWDYFRVPLTTALPYVSPVEISETDGLPSIYFSASIRNAEGQIVGVLRVRYNAAILQQIVANASGLAGKQSFAILLDENHIRLADGSMPELIFKSVVPLDPAKVAALQAAHRLPRRPAELLSTHLPELEQGLANAAEQPFFRAELEQPDTNMEKVAVKSMTTQPWLVMFAQAEDVFLAPVAAQARNSLPIGAIIIVLVVLASIQVTKGLTGPIVRLTAVAERVRAGDLGARAQPEADDEIGQLATSFNTMTAQLQQTLDGLDERTHELGRVNLELERSLRVKDEFLANMSHELRTPLNAIIGLSESLEEQIAGLMNEKQLKYVNTIHESGHHLLELINDILDLAKIESGQFGLDRLQVDINSVCQSSLRMIKQLAQKKNLEVLLEISDRIDRIWGDERRLKQMLVNLLSNAVKFTSDNGKIGLKVHGDRDENKVTFTVWDTGIGIKEEDLFRLFRPFVQLDSDLARKTTGTGLGLALVAQMARLHGGSVSAESQPGSGSYFSITLPWESALAMDTTSKLKITGKFRVAKPDAHGRRQTILLVEDTDEVIMVIRDYLEYTGYNVEIARNGTEGIIQAKKVRPELILMDIQMPDMDGLETTLRLRSEVEFQQTPIIALTALAMKGDRERCLAAGMNDYISKPVHLKSLVKAIQNLLPESENKQLQ